MKDQAGKYLAELARQEKQFSSLYREVSGAFGMPECAFWVLYFVVSADKPLSQQELVGKMMFPKQTVNSAVSALVKNGYAKLDMLSGTRKRKEIILTDSGKTLAEQTVKALLRAELNAVRRFNSEKMECYLGLQGELLKFLREEFTRTGLIVPAAREMGKKNEK